MSATRSDARPHGEAGGGEDTSPASPACFAAFAERVRPVLVKVARGYVPPHLADDVAQSALEVTFRKWDRVGLMDRPVAYAVTVAKHRAIDYLRQQGRESVVANEELTPVIEARQLREAPSSDVDVLALLQSLVDEVPGRAGEVLRLSLHGHTSQEIAELLDVSPATVRVLLHRARQQLKDSDVVRRRTRPTRLT